MKLKASKSTPEPPSELKRPKSLVKAVAVTTCNFEVSFFFLIHHVINPKLRTSPRV